MSKILNFETGSITIFCLLLLLILSLLFIKFIYWQETAFQRVRDRKNTYLCFKEMNFLSQNLSSKVADLNRAILFAENIKFLTLLIPGINFSSLTLEETKEVIKNFQNYFLASYVLKVKKSLRCSIQTKLFFLKTPYEHNLIYFKRLPNGLTKLREDWPVVIKGKYLLLLPKYLIKDNLSKLKLKSLSEEKGLLKSNWSFGSHSSSFSF